MKKKLFFIVVLVFSAFTFADFASANEKGGSLSYEGKIYKTVKIGKQEWMAENLNYKSKNGNGKNICAGCEDFGRLYTWNSAMNIKQETKENYEMESRTEDRPISKKHQGICPAGWHIPTVEDMVELLTFVNVYLFKKQGDWNDSFLKYIRRDIAQFIFPESGTRSRSAMQATQAHGTALCEPGYWAGDGAGNDPCDNEFGLNIRSSGNGKYRELDKCKPGMFTDTDFSTGEKVCCSEGCAGDSFVMWLANENTSCQDKVIRGRHSCEYVPKAALFRFQQYVGSFLQDIDWEYKNSYASVRCVKD